MANAPEPCRLPAPAADAGRPVESRIDPRRHQVVPPGAVDVQVVPRQAFAAKIEPRQQRTAALVLGAHVGLQPVRLRSKKSGTASACVDSGAHKRWVRIEMRAAWLIG